jgi:uncharacterized membrane-anchored protein YitT (DUF2179 family)
LILAPFVPIGSVTLIAILNMVLFLLGLIFLGKRFALNSLLSTILYPLFTVILSRFDPAPFKTVDPILSAIYSGLLIGVGLGLVFRQSASTGGMDIPALILHKYARIPQGTSVMIVDSLTILCGLAVYGLNSVLTGLIAVFITSQSINFTQTLGAQSAYNVMVISEKWEEIRTFLLGDIDRGVTILSGKGAYSNTERPVLMCVISTRQYARIESKIAAIDPKAFIIVTNVHEVRGSGFTFKDGSL